MKNIKIIIVIVASLNYYLKAAYRTEPLITYKQVHMQNFADGLARKDYVQGLQQMNKKGLIAQNGVDKKGENILHKAVRENSLKLARSLTNSENFDINQQNLDGQTPLHIAAKARSEGMVNLLIDADQVDFDVQDARGRTALHWACYDASIDSASRGDHGDAVALLLIRGSQESNLDLQDEYGYTPLHVAVLAKRYAIISELSMIGAKLDEQDLNNQTPLHLAVLQNDADAVKILLQAGARADVVDAFGKVPYDYVADQKVIDVFKQHFGLKFVKT